MLDTPLAESSIVGVAIGLATNGCTPVAEIQFADFAFPAFNQLISEAARWRYRSNNGWGCPIVVRAPFGAGIRGALYHSQSIEALLAHVPGLKIVAPSTPYDAKGLLKAAIRDPDPVIYFEHKKAYRSVKGEVPDGDYLRADRAGGAAPRGRRRHGHQLRVHGARVPAGGRGRGGGGHRRDGAGPAHARAARPRRRSWTRRGAPGRC